MKKDLLLLSLLFASTTALWASNVITYKATSKLSETTNQYSSGFHTNAFNVAITSHEFADSIGTITFAGEVTSIGDMAFLQCSSLTSITLPNSVTSIGERAFSGCSSLTSIYVDPANIHYASIDGVLFNFAKDTLIQYPIGNPRTTYTIPNTVTSIGNLAFYDCPSLTSITIPNSVTSIGDDAFYKCTSLPVENNLRYADTYLVEAVDKTLSTYTIKDGTKWIGDDAFESCDSLTSLTIPNSVTSIGNLAFYRCTSLTTITIPNSVTSIGERAFGICHYLTSITCYAVEPPTCGMNCFNGITKSIPVYVPSESVDAYKAADQWKDFTNIQAIGAEPTIAPDSVITEPTETSITITWPTNDSTFFYDLVVYDADSNVVCIVSFDANGTMTGITYPAPGRYGNAAVAAEEVPIGYRFTITGLDPGTNYTYAVIYKDEEGDITHTESGAFTTTGSITGMNEVDNAQCTMHGVSKVMRNGQLYILHDGRICNAQGAAIQ